MSKLNQSDLDLGVAAKIYETTVIKREKIWFDKLVRLLKGYSSETKIGDALVNLYGLGVIDVEKGVIKKGVEGKCLYITDERKDTIERVYINFTENNLYNSPKST